MIEIIKDTLIDSIKLIPFLLITYILMEYIEHKMGKKSKEIIKKSDKYGPLFRKHTWSISTMWIFSISNKLICSKSNNTRNTNICIFINIR